MSIEVDDVVCLDDEAGAPLPTGGVGEAMATPSTQDVVERVVPSSSAPPTPSTLVATIPLGQPTMTVEETVAQPTSVAPLYPLPPPIPEGQTGAAKDALLGAEQMILRAKEVYEASKLLRDNVRVSTIVCSSESEFCFVFAFPARHPLGRVYLGRYGIASKPPSVRVAHDSEKFCT